MVTYELSIKKVGLSFLKEILRLFLKKKKKLLPLQTEIIRSGRKEFSIKGTTCRRES